MRVWWLWQRVPTRTRIKIYHGDGFCAIVAIAPQEHA